MIVLDENFDRFHPAFRTNAQRLGTVVHVGYAGVRLWRVNAQVEEAVPWADRG